MDRKSIIFMGTPEFAVSSLENLIQKNYNVIGVITAIDKERGRGRKIKYSPIKEYAIKNKIPLFQPDNLKDDDFIRKIKLLKPDLFVVVAFRMLPEILISIPKYGCINLHSSILPNYRGAAPINWVIINGEKETGVTTFFINKNIDEGDIIEINKIKITEDETAGSLHDKLKILGSNLVEKTVKNIFKNNFKREKQIISSDDPIAPKINKDICRIDVNSDRNSIIRLVRGLSPYPGAKLNFNNKVYKILNCKKSNINFKSKSVMFVENNKLYFNNYVSESIEIIEIQAEGKKIMSSSDFLRGNKL